MFTSWQNSLLSASLSTFPQNKDCARYSVTTWKNPGPPSYCSFNFSMEGSCFLLETPGMNPGHPERTLLQAPSGCSGDTNEDGRWEVLSEAPAWLWKTRPCGPSEHWLSPLTGQDLSSWRCICCREARNPFPFSPAPGVSPKEGHKHNLCETTKRKKIKERKKTQVEFDVKNIYKTHFFIFTDRHLINILPR